MVPTLFTFNDAENEFLINSIAQTAPFSIVQGDAESEAIWLRATVHRIIDACRTLHAALDPSALLWILADALYTTGTGPDAVWRVNSELITEKCLEIGEEPVIILKIVHDAIMETTVQLGAHANLKVAADAEKPLEEAGDAEHALIEVAQPTKPLSIPAEAEATIITDLCDD